MAFNWTCPFCDRPQTVTGSNFSKGSFHFITSKPVSGHIGLGGESIVCSNPDCEKVTVLAYVLKANRTPVGTPSFPNNAEYVLIQSLIPTSAAKPQPDFIPSPLRDDYEESCKIKNLSPKASATLSRRCIQGMIRDFCGIKKNRLIDEINELKKRIEQERAPKGVSDDSVEAIDAVRKIGNIGAHMEKDINLIIDVDPDEAQILIELIETLFDEWYIEREKRKQRFAKIGAIASAIGEQKRISGEKLTQIEAPKPETDKQE